MKYILIVVFILVVISGCNTSTTTTNVETKVDSITIDSAQPTPFVGYNIVKWMNKPVNEIGCLWYNEFGMKDSVFNCDMKEYINQGDPCDNYEAYYEGPKFKAKPYIVIHPAIASINVSFEHGNVQDIDVAFKSKISIDSVKKIFNLTKYTTKLPDNVISIYYGSDSVSGKTDIVSFTAFEHVGEGDVNCE